MNESELKIEAIVKFNSDYAYVFNRTPDLRYREVDGLLIGQDGPFISSLFYRRSTGRSDRAFAGRELSFQMTDGSIKKYKDSWWSGGSSRLKDRFGLDLVNIPRGTVTELKDCYVFCSIQVDKTALEEMIEKYDGTTYEYWDYEKVIKFDDMHRKYIYKQLDLERDKKNIIKEAKKWAKLARELSK